MRDPWGPFPWNALETLGHEEVIWFLEAALGDYINYTGFHAQQDASRRITATKQELLRRLNGATV